MSQIAASFAAFGITSATTDLLVLKVSTPAAPVAAEAVAAHLGANVEGSSIAFGDAEIARATDMPRIRKAYKLKDPAVTGAAAGRNRKARQVNGGGEDAAPGPGEAVRDDDAARERKEVEIAVLAMMALKGS